MKSVCLLFAMSVLGVVHANAQTQVLDVDTPGRHPVQVTIAQTVTNAGYNEIVVYKVPAGVRFVLEYAGGDCNSPLGLRGVQIITDGATAAAAVNYRYPVNQTTLGNNFETYFATPVRAYVEAGHSVTVNFFGDPNNSQTFQCGVSITGYLILP